MDLKPEGFDSLQEVADAIASYQPQRKRPASPDGLAKNVRLGADGKYHWHWDPRFRTGARDLKVLPTGRIKSPANQSDADFLDVPQGWPI